MTETDVVTATKLVSRMFIQKKKKREIKLIKKEKINTNQKLKMVIQSCCFVGSHYFLETDK